MEKTPILIVGTDYEAVLAHEIAQALDVFVYGFLYAENEEPEFSEINDLPVIGSIESEDAKTLLEQDDLKVFVASLDVYKRRGLVREIRRKTEQINITIQHPRSNISHYAQVGAGNLIDAFTHIEPNVQIGNFNLIHSHVSIANGVDMGNYNTIQAGVKIGKEVQMGDYVVIGMGAIIYPGVHIGDEAVIGAGSVVLKDVKPGENVFGNPAKTLNI